MVVLGQAIATQQVDATASTRELLGGKIRRDDQLFEIARTRGIVVNSQVVDDEAVQGRAGHTQTQ
jgi:hypothetical protein